MVNNFPLRAGRRQSLLRSILPLLVLLLTAGTAVAQTTVSPALRARLAAGRRVPLIVTTRPGRDASAEAAHHGGSSGAS